LFDAKRKREDSARPLLVKRIALWGGAILLVLIAVYAFPQTRNALWLLYASPSAGESTIYSGDRGIIVTDASGKAEQEFAVTTQAGAKIRAPQYAFVGDSLVYWSPEDYSLAIVRRQGPKGWVSLLTHFGEHDALVALRPGRDSINAVIQDRSDAAEARAKSRPSKVLTISIPQGIVQLQPETPDALYGENQSVVREHGGNFVLKDVAGSSRTILSEEHAFDWDYDFVHSKLGASDRSQVVLAGGNEKVSWNPAFLHAISGVWMRPEKSEVWVELARPMSMGAAVISYDLKGDQKSLVLKDSGRARGPFYSATAERKNLLENAIAPGN